MILLIDNYDSFSYNLVDYFKQLGQQVTVIKNDQITLANIERLAPAMIVLSPGPGHPQQAGITLAVIQAFAGKIPLLGICLGHQAIAVAFGGNIVTAPHPMHGKIDKIKHDGLTLFNQLPSSFQVTRYHSLIVEKASLPNCLMISAENSQGIIMALRHKQFAIEGLQFHPEAILTQHGLTLLQRFIDNYINYR